MSWSDPDTRPKIKHKELLSKLREHGMVAKKTGFGDEYRVNFKGGHEDSAHYTDDRHDALHTGVAMAKRAEDLRMKGQGSHDPVYDNSKKNK